MRRASIPSHPCHFLPRGTSCRYPLKKEKRARAVPVPPPEDLGDAELAAAAAAVAAEAEALRSEHGHAALGPEEYYAAWEAVQAERARAGGLGALQREFERVRACMEADAKRAAKLDGKISTVTAGYQKRAQELGLALGALQAQARRRRMRCAAPPMRWRGAIAQPRGAALRVRRTRTAARAEEQGGWYGSARVQNWSPIGMRLACGVWNGAWRGRAAG